MSNETKIGVLAIVTIGLFIWGYKFLKGQNILSSSKNIYVKYHDVEQLGVSSPVLINGLEVGVVKDIYLDPNSIDSVMVILNIKGSVNFPKNSIACIVPTGLMGGKAVEIRYDHICSGDCVQDKDSLKGCVESMIKAMLGDPSESEQYLASFKKNIRGIMDSVDASIKTPSNSIGVALNDLESTLHNLKNVTANLDVVLKNSSTKLNGTMSNLNSITGNLEAGNQDIKKILANINTLTDQLKNAGLDQTSKSANSALTQANDVLKKSEEAVKELTTVLNKVNKSEGTMGKLVNDPKLYDNLQVLTKDLDRTTKNMDLLLQDFRLNPKRYVNVGNHYAPHSNCG